MSSASFDFLPVERVWFAGVDILRPKFVPKAGESLIAITNVDDAQREFLRMFEVTNRISDRRTCFNSAGLGELLSIATEESRIFNHSELFDWVKY